MMNNYNYPIFSYLLEGQIQSLMGWMSMGLSMLQAIQEEVDHSEEISRLKGELWDARDDLELKETLLKSSKENIGLLEGQLGSFKEEVAKKDRVLAERDELLSAEKKKAEFNAAKLKESEMEIA
jgi:chromosome segregation ATPase